MAASAYIFQQSLRFPSLSNSLRTFRPHSKTIAATITDRRADFLGRKYSDSAIDPVEAPEYLSEGERRVFDTLKDGLNPSKLEVQDVSGGCGSMFALDIVSEQFQGLTVIKQHRLVNKILGEEMKQWHGVQLKTKAP